MENLKTITETKVYRKENWYRPLFIDIGDNCYELDNIHIYNENGILLSVGRGYFDNDTSITVKGEILRKLKTNFTCKQHYIVKSKDTLLGDIKYELYLYKEKVDFKFVRVYKQYDYILAEYNVNGGEFSSFIKNIGETKSNIKLRLEKEIKKINTTYDYPLDIVELDNTLTEIQTLNSDLIKEKQRIENYKVVEKDWEKYIIR